MTIFLEPVRSSVGILLVEDFYWKFGKCRRQKTVLFGGGFFRSGTSKLLEAIELQLLIQIKRLKKIKLDSVADSNTFKNPIFLCVPIVIG